MTWYSINNGGIVHLQYTVLSKQQASKWIKGLTNLPASSTCDQCNAISLTVTFLLYNSRSLPDLVIHPCLSINMPFPKEIVKVKWCAKSTIHSNWRLSDILFQHADWWYRGAQTKFCCPHNPTTDGGWQLIILELPFVKKSWHSIRVTPDFCWPRDFRLSNVMLQQTWPLNLQVTKSFMYFKKELNKDNIDWGATCWCLGYYVSWGFCIWQPTFNWDEPAD